MFFFRRCFRKRAREEGKKERNIISSHPILSLCAHTNAHAHPDEPTNKHTHIYTLALEMAQKSNHWKIPFSVYEWMMRFCVVRIILHDTKKYQHTHTHKKKIGMATWSNSHISSLVSCYGLQLYLSTNAHNVFWAWRMICLAPLCLSSPLRSAFLKFVLFLFRCACVRCIIFVCLVVMKWSS